MKSVNLSVLSNYVVWFVGVDVEFVLSCRSDPLGRDGDESGKNTVKSVQNEKYSAKSADSLRFLLYLCHVIDDYACLDLQH